MTAPKCVGCGQPSTTTFDGIPACARCAEVLARTWPEGLIRVVPLSYVEGASMLADIITGRAR